MRSISSDKKHSRLVTIAALAAIVLLAFAGTTSAGWSGPHSVADVIRYELGLVPNAPLGKSTIGDYVWYDKNADGFFNGQTGEAEYTGGINGVVVERWIWNGAAYVLDNSDPVNNPATATTDANGKYTLGATASATLYHIVIAASNFDPGGPLYGHVYTSGSTINPYVTMPNVLIADYKDADFGYAKTSVQVTKSPAIQYLLPGSTATFTINVTNTGAVALSNIVVSDPGYPSCARTIPGPLAAGASTSYQCTVTNVQTNFSNVASVTGTPVDSQGNPLPGSTPTDTSDPALVQVVNPKIDVEKYVSVDGGVTWDDADSVTGPYSNGTAPKYRFVVTNTGNVSLSNVSLSDDPVLALFADVNLSAPCVPTSPLPVGGTFTCYGTSTWAAGQHKDTATARGTYTDGSGTTYTTTDTDDAHYFGSDPKIDVEKYVSVDGGVTWDDADSVTGPYSNGTAPKYRFVVTNTGNVSLSNVSLSDDPVLALFADVNLSAPCVPTSPLPVGGVFTCYGTSTWAAGQQKDTATASGTYTDSTGNTKQATDADEAHYFGADPKIDVEKYVSVDGGVTWDDADAAPGPTLNMGTNPRFKFVVTNTGNVALTNVTVTDSDFSLPAGCIVSSLAVGASDDCVVTSIWVAGQHANTASASGTFTDSGNTPKQASDTDDAHYFGARPELTLIKTAGTAPDGTSLVVAPPLPVNVLYTYEVKNTGNVAVANITVSDNLLGAICTIAGPLQPGASHTCTKSAAISQDTQNVGTASGTAQDANGNSLGNVSGQDDAWVLVRGVIGNFVWWDVNANGIQDPGEPGIPGVDLTIPGKTVTTDGTGTYLIDGLTSGSYTVVIPATEFGPGGTLEGFTRSSALVGGDTTKDSNGTGGLGGSTQASVTLPAYASDLTIDFGFVKLTSYTIDKKTITTSPTTPGKEVHYQITIKNTGQTYITTLPLSDSYSTSYLTYGFNGTYAVPASDDNLNDGTITWADVTGAGTLAPGGSLVVDVYFTAKEDTTGLPGGTTPNTATIPQQGTLVDPDGPDGAIPPATTPQGPTTDQDVVQIIQPTGVTLAQVSATRTAEGILVVWETGDERAILGFHVLRGTSAETLVPITEELMVAHRTGTSGGDVYSFLDLVAPGEYLYGLEVVGLDGRAQVVLLGPATLKR